MGQRARREIGVAKDMTEAGLQRREFGLRPLAHGRDPMAGNGEARARPTPSPSARPHPPRRTDAAHDRVDKAGLRPRVQWTRWNSRLQRTVQGQRQNCQAGAPSSTEKKMISARPIRFSAGT